MVEKINKYFNLFKDGTKTMFKEFFKKETNKKQRANMWTFSRLVTSFLIVICSISAVLTLNPFLFIGSSVLTAFGGITDFFDGRSARKHESSSEYGKLLDQVTDKIFTGLVGISLLLVNPYYLLILFGEGIIASINIAYMSKHKDLKINSTKIGRIKQWPLCASLVLGFLSPINAVLNTIANLTVDVVMLIQLLTASSYIKQNNDEIKQIEKNKKLSILQSIDEECKEKTKSLELTKCNNNIEIDNSKSLSRKEQYQALRNVLSEIAEKKIINEDLSMQLKK